ncbi:hypothetical protein [Actinomadura roseirufa]|nr:hypothetical protein [Actinomadura roseirufa]
MTALAEGFAGLGGRHAPPHAHVLRRHRSMSDWATQAVGKSYYTF